MGPKGYPREATRSPGQQLAVGSDVVILRHARAQFALEIMMSGSNGSGASAEQLCAIFFGNFGLLISTSCDVYFRSLRVYFWVIVPNVM